MKVIKLILNTIEIRSEEADCRVSGRVTPVLTILPVKTSATDLDSFKEMPDIKAFVKAIRMRHMNNVIVFHQWRPCHG